VNKFLTFQEALRELSEQGALEKSDAAHRLYQDDIISVDKHGAIYIVRSHEYFRETDTEYLHSLLAPYFSGGVFWILWEKGQSEVIREYGEVPEELWVSEQGAKFIIRPKRHPHGGIFLDTAPVRTYIKKHAKDLRVLNLFSFTCSLSVAAHLGGAAFVRNIDSHKGALRWGDENLKGNSVPHESASMICEDVGKFLHRIKENTYDMILFDPPSFGVSGHDQFSLKNDFGTVFHNLKKALSASGKLILMNHDRNTSLPDLAREPFFKGFSRVHYEKSAWNSAGPSSAVEWMVLKKS